MDRNAGMMIGLDGPVNSLTLDEFLDYCDEDDRGGIREAYSALIREPGSSRGVEFRVKSRKDGIYRWARAAGKSHTEDSRLTVMGIVQILEGGKAFDFLLECIDNIDEKISRKHQLFQQIHTATKLLLNAEAGGYLEPLEKSLGFIAGSVHVERISIYKNNTVSGEPFCTLVHQWPDFGNPRTADIAYSEMPRFEEVIRNGGFINGPPAGMYSGFRKHILGDDAVSVLVIPVYLKEVFWGFVSYEDCKSERIFAADEESALAAASLLLANTVIRHEIVGNLKEANDQVNTTTRKVESLEKEAHTDSLTNIYNRRHFTALALGYLERMRRFDSPCCAMILDLDFFKKVNDTWGHQAGDEVLKGTAAIIKGILRSYDLLARYGGEEFIVLAPDTTKNAAFALAGRIREEIEHNPCTYNGVEIPVTVSIGVTQSFPGCTLEDLIEGADRGLYEAKEKGRNRVIEYEFPALKKGRGKNANKA
jgi:diguanylate cyclase (GGDEF)-like protein